MTKHKTPATAAIRQLRQHQVDFSDHPYRYTAGGGTRVSALELGVDEHQVIKTLIMEDENGNPLIVLMHGDREVSTKALARHIGVKSITPCKPAVADRHSGYQVGGTSPFGTRKRMPVYCEESILALQRIYINGGRRGYLICLAADDLQRVLNPTLVSAAQ
ncbi:Cys-tRNA(Pro) deacylase [Sedimenticola hydrogenitrophicus]|uniref:Cys-tRNA(Pro) deacylase n=1 Tax=Sedimenticola hydrogenitrophicus TaxID=2967975 RepID=UPI0023B12183